MSPFFRYVLTADDEALSRMHQRYVEAIRQAIRQTGVMTEPVEKGKETPQAK